MSLHREIDNFIANYSPPPADTPEPVLCGGMLRPGLMDNMRAYVGSTWALLQMGRDDEPQAAFNVLYAAMKAHVPESSQAWRRPTWVWIKPLPSDSDPFAQHGYIGVKWKENSDAGA